MKRKERQLQSRGLNRQTHKRSMPAVRRHLIAANMIAPLQTLAGIMGVSRTSLHKIIEGEYVRKSDISSMLILAAMKKIAYGEKDPDLRRAYDILIAGYDKAYRPIHHRKIDLPFSMSRFINDNPHMGRARTIKFFTDQGVLAPVAQTAWRRVHERMEILHSLMSRYLLANPDASETDAVEKFRTVPEERVVQVYHEVK